MATQISEGASALPDALAIIPSLPRPMLSRLVARMIERMDEIDGDADCDEDDAEDAFGFSGFARACAEEAGPGCMVSDEDSGVEDDPLGIDPEEDYCTSGEDRGTCGWLTPAQKREVRRIKQAAKALRKAVQ